MLRLVSNKGHARLHAPSGCRADAPSPTGSRRKPGGGTPQVFRLFGYAGTGKTTLAKHIAEGVDGKVLFAAFTGKAAW